MLSLFSLILYPVLVLIPYDEYQHQRSQMLKRATALLSQNPESREGINLLNDIQYMFRLKYKFLILYYNYKFFSAKNKQIPDFLLKQSA